ncbi:MAG TPA: hypothetical protein PLO37_08715 [Candidatus Hydrogenedentes bacterium]|nr:hypothetical protein [Candidatus Hydrogenedentota bacterium]HPG66915.1 hypothetical protein [Candidatus Hydrogenedentota bacterium]
MKRLLIYVDASVVGGCEDREFSEGSLLLWRCFAEGRYRMALSELTLNELKGAPAASAQTGRGNPINERSPDSEPG